jgi:DNA-binding IclR family transcriptional regulator
MTGTADDSGSEAQRQGIQSIELAMRVLVAVETGRGPLSLTQIAAASGMSASKAHRYLVSLGRAGLVAQSQRAGLYDFGPAMRRIGIEALRRIDEVAIASEFLPTLRDRTTHSVNLAVWGDHGPVLVHWEYGSHALSMNVRIGSTVSLIDSSVGRVFLAYLPEAMTRPVLEVDGETHSADRVAAIKLEVTGRGTALTSGSIVAGLTVVAAPVFSDGALPLAVSVAIPSRLADAQTVEEVESELVATASRITGALGGRHRDA